MMIRDLNAQQRSADDWAHIFVFQNFMLHHEWDAGASVTLHYWRGDFYVYVDEVYRRLPEEDLAVCVRDFLVNPKRFFVPGSVDRGCMEPCENVSARFIDEVVALLKCRAEIYIASHRESPGWLGQPPNGAPPRPMLNMGNGLLDLEGALDGAADPLHGHSPRWFDTVRLPYAFDPKAACPRWRTFLDDVLMGDEGLIDLLQRWCGYLLTPDTRQHKCLIAVGEGANGKSVLFRVVEAMLGEQNVSHVPLEVFGERFALNATVGKLANIVSEVGEMDRVAEGRLKEFIAADTMTLDRKFREPQTVKPTARLMLATNNLPRFNDKTGGIWRRIILLPFNRTFAPHEQDRGLTEKLIGELPGILNWAIDGLKRLRTEETFPETPVASQALADYKLDCNPAREFLLENYHDNSPGFVTAREVYQRYLQWCADTGHRPLADRVFGKEVRRAFPTVERKCWGGRLNRQWIYEGLQEI